MKNETKNIINIYIRDNISTDLDIKRISQKVVNYVLDYFNCKYICEIEITITNNEEIRQINNETRSIDKATDVLSFPYLEFDKPGQINDNFELNPENDSLYLGEIIISIDKVIEQANEYNHSNIREFAFLLTHSMLHLLGYDHMVKDDEDVMFKLQDELLDLMNYER